MRALRFLTRRLQRWRPLGASVEYIGRNVAITYRGQRSGRTFRTPVAYRRSGDEIEIAANMPDAKNWWPNFVGRAHC
jgi:hypothetical protein